MKGLQDLARAHAEKVLRSVASLAAHEAAIEKERGAWKASLQLFPPKVVFSAYVFVVLSYVVCEASRAHPARCWWNPLFHIPSNTHCQAWFFQGALRWFCRSDA